MNSIDAPFHLACVSPEFLTQSNGGCILQMGAADLEDGKESPFLCLQRLMETPECGTSFC